MGGARLHCGKGVICGPVGSLALSTMFSCVHSGVGHNCNRALGRVSTLHSKLTN